MNTSTKVVNIPIWQNLSPKNLINELWTPLKGLEGIYEVSNLGRLKSIDRIITNKNGISSTYKGRMLKASKDKDGYLFNSLICGTVRRHRAVLMSFSINNDNKEQVNHIDADKENNALGNLEWTTPKENIKHSIDNNLQDFCRGEKVGTSKLKKEDVIFIRNNYKKGNGKELAIKFNVNGSCISKIVNKIHWKHL